MTKKRTVVPDFSAHAKPGSKRKVCRCQSLTEANAKAASANNAAGTLTLGGDEQ